MLTPKIDPEESFDDIDEGLRRYSNMLVTLGYAANHDGDVTIKDIAAYYGAQATFTTTGMDTNAMTFKPTSREG